MVGLEAHEYEERRGEDEQEGGERKPQRDATDRSGVGAQLLEDELAAWAIATEARSATEAARATGGCRPHPHPNPHPNQAPRRDGTLDRLRPPAASVMHPSAASCTG